MHYCWSRWAGKLQSSHFPSRSVLRNGPISRTITFEFGHWLSDGASRGITVEHQQEKQNKLVSRTEDCLSFSRLSSAYGILSCTWLLQPDLHYSVAGMERAAFVRSFAWMKHSVTHWEAVHKRSVVAAPQGDLLQMSLCVCADADEEPRSPVKSGTKDPTGQIENSRTLIKCSLPIQMSNPIFPCCRGGEAVLETWAPRTRDHRQVAPQEQNSAARLRWVPFLSENFPRTQRTLQFVVRQKRTPVRISSTL